MCAETTAAPFDGGNEETSMARNPNSSGALILRLIVGLALLGCTSPSEVTRGHIEPTVPYDPVA